MRIHSLHQFLWLYFCLIGCGPTTEIREQGERPTASEEEKLALRDQVANPFRGYVAINTHLRQSVFDGEQFDIARFLEDERTLFDRLISPKSLSDTLGATKGQGTRSERSGQAPNAMNIMLWRIVIDRTAHAIMLACDASSERDPGLTLRPVLVASVTPICDRNAWSEASLHDYYDALLGPLGSDTHFESWSRYFLGQTGASEDDLNIASLTLAALFSPEFLVRR